MIISWFPEIQTTTAVSRLSAFGCAFEPRFFGCLPSAPEVSPKSQHGCCPKLTHQFDMFQPNISRNKRQHPWFYNLHGFYNVLQPPWLIHDIFIKCLDPILNRDMGGRDFQDTPKSRHVGLPNTAPRPHKGQRRHQAQLHHSACTELFQEHFPEEALNFNVRCTTSSFKRKVTLFSAETLMFFPKCSSINSS